jgi:uncharacterized protein
MVREDAQGVLIDILVQPRASRPKIGPVHGDRVKVAVTAPPVDGKANAAVIDDMARFLAVPRQQIEVVSGTGSRRKTVRVRGLDAGAVRAAIGELS